MAADSTRGDSRCEQKSQAVNLALKLRAETVAPEEEEE
jgi:hypothetical protein